MGLPCQVTDFSTETIFFLTTTVTNFFCYLQSLLHAILGSLGFPFKQDDEDGDELVNGSSGPGHGLDLNLNQLAAQQLSLNRLSSEAYGDPAAEGDSDSPACVVCLSCLREGDQVRRLDCGHVFHKHCFDGWLQHLNFNCPLCRTPLVSEERDDLAA